MSGWHSASWSRGNEPFAGGLGRPILTPVPGAPKVDMVEGGWVGFDFVVCVPWRQASVSVWSLGVVGRDVEDRRTRAIM